MANRKSVQLDMERWSERRYMWAVMIGNELRHGSGELVPGRTNISGMIQSVPYQGTEGDAHPDE